MSVLKFFNIYVLFISASFARKRFDTFRFLGGFSCDYSVVELVRKFLRRIGVFLRGAFVPVGFFVKLPLA